jgi:hypothetical protein
VGRVAALAKLDVAGGPLEEWLNGVREDLRVKTYQPQAVRRVVIPKPGLDYYFSQLSARKRIAQGL